MQPSSVILPVILIIINSPPSSLSPFIPQTYNKKNPSIGHLLTDFICRCFTTWAHSKDQKWKKNNRKWYRKWNIIFRPFHVRSLWHPFYHQLSAFQTHFYYWFLFFFFAAFYFMVFVFFFFFIEIWKFSMAKHFYSRLQRVTNW